MGKINMMQTTVAQLKECSRLGIECLLVRDSTLVESLCCVLKQDTLST